jgi:CheY-like chemotaxis protein
MLLVDNDPPVVEILTQMLRGFGATNLRSAESAAEAKRFIESGKIDLIICELTLGDMDGLELIRWIRHRKEEQTRFVPIIALTGYTEFSRVSLARDAGANIVIKKPISPQVFYDRLAWISHSARPFVETETYIGPDRRFKSLGPPNGIGRRSSDLSAEVGAASEPNMSQDEIDSLMKPMRIITV